MKGVLDEWVVFARVVFARVLIFCAQARGFQIFFDQTLTARRLVFVRRRVGSKIPELVFF